MRRIQSHDPDEKMPPGGDGLKPEQVAWFRHGSKTVPIWPAPPVTEQDVTPPPVLADAAFLRCVFLDTVEFHLH